MHVFAMGATSEARTAGRVSECSIQVLVLNAPTIGRISGSLFRASLTNGKGNKAETLRLRSGDTGLMSWLGSAL